MAFDLRPYQQDGVNGIRDAFKDHKSVLYSCPTGGGKAQPVSSLVLSPDGWLSMGDVKIGDVVLTKERSHANVIGVFPQGVQQVFKITFFDGRSARCTEDHLWKFFTLEETKVASLLELKKSLDEERVWIPVIDPPNLDFSLSDTVPLGTVAYKPYDGEYDVVYKMPADQSAFDLVEKIREMGGVSYADPFEAYSKGVINVYCSHVNQNFLHSDFPNNFYNMSRCMLQVSSIEEDGFEDCQCIAIDDPSHLYITDNYIVTHNTVIFSHIVNAVEKKSKSVTILVHREELVTQCSMSLAENGLNHRLIVPTKVQRDIQRDHINKYGSIYLHPATDVVVASVQTLIRRFDKLPPPDLIIADEAHHVTPKSGWGKVFEKYPDARKLGVTATPERLDGKGLDNCFDTLVKGPGIKELIDMRYLCVPKLFSHDGVRTEDLRTKFGDYDKKGLEERSLARAIVGDVIEHYMSICPHVPAIAFCVSVRHSEIMAETFRAAGLRAISLDGTTDKNVRKNALIALGNGSLDIICSCDLISEGVDVPLVAAAILLRPTQSLSLYLQQIGRVLRRYPNSPIMQRPHMSKLVDGNIHFAFILDHAGNWMRHGVPQADRDWVLTKDKQKKNKNMGAGVHQCPNCHESHEIGPDQCPFCGHSYIDAGDSSGLSGMGGKNDIVHVEGTLNEISDTPHWAGGLSVSDSPLNKLTARAFTKSHFQEIAAARGYKQGWVHFAMKEKINGIEKGARR